MQQKHPMPLIAISACLTGQAVRYDGRHKYTPSLIESLKKSAALLPVCPETAIGLPTPRNKIRLTEMRGEIRVLDSINPDIDLTCALHDYALHFLTENPIAGLAMQEKSPSCGIGNCRLFAENGAQIGFGSGVFAATVIAQCPQMPVCCAEDLQSARHIQHFIERVRDYSLKPVSRS